MSRVLQVHCLTVKPITENGSTVALPGAGATLLRLCVSGVLALLAAAYESAAASPFLKDSLTSFSLLNLSVSFSIPFTLPL